MDFKRILETISLSYATGTSVVINLLYAKRLIRNKKKNEYFSIGKSLLRSFTVLKDGFYFESGSPFRLLSQTI